MLSFRYKLAFLKVGKGTIVKWFAKGDFTAKLARIAVPGTGQAGRRRLKGMA
jgi:hypothetical protein